MSWVEARMLLWSRALPDRKVLYLVPVPALLFPFVPLLLLHKTLSGFVLFLACAGLIPLFTDRLTALGDEVWVRIGLLRSPGFYPMRWGIRLDEEKAFEVREETGGHVLFALGHGKVMMPVYRARKASTAARLAGALSAFYTAPKALYRK